MPAVGALVRSTNSIWIARPLRPRWIALAIHNFHNSGNTTTMRGPLAVVAAFFDRLGRYEPAAIIAGFAFSPLTAASFPNINKAIGHLREVLSGPDLRIACP
jgi:hypothetical protein